MILNEQEINSKLMLNLNEWQQSNNQLELIKDNIQTDKQIEEYKTKIIDLETELTTNKESIDLKNDRSMITFGGFNL